MYVLLALAAAVGSVLYWVAASFVVYLVGRDDEKTGNFVLYFFIVIYVCLLGLLSMVF